MGSGAGRIRVRPSVFDVYDWNCTAMTAQSIVYRPSARTLVRRLGGTLAAAIVAGALLAYVVHLRGAYPGGMSETVFNACVAVCAAIAALGLVSPLSVAWNRVSIFIEGRNRIAVVSRGIWSTTCRMTIDRSTCLCVRAAEKVTRRRHAGIVRLGHRWTVSIGPAPSLDLIGATVGSIDFEVHHQKDRPVEEMPLPPRVRTFVEGLERMTGLSAGPHAILDYQGSTGFWGGRRHWVSSGSGPTVQTRTIIGKPIVTSRTVRYDEMPPELRAQFEALRARAGAGADETVTTEIVSDGGAITYRDARGAVHTYRSLDEMPADVRALFDAMRNATRAPRDEA